MTLFRSLALIVITTAAGATASAQEAPSPSAFSLSSSQIFTTKGEPAVDLLFQQLTHLDFRVYRVKDARAFFAGLEDPHQLGSPEPVVPQEQTWLERIASWKAARRSDIKDLLRAQVSTRYRAERRARANKAEIQQRQTLGYQSFAQVPLLNQSQLVASWREMLPRTRDAEARRLPLELPGPGVYLVEAVNPPQKAYTIVIVSDVGLVTKTAPGQALLFAANRFSGQPIPGCTATMLADRKAVLSGVTASDGVIVESLPPATPDDLIAVAQCGNETVATDAGAWSLNEGERDLVGYVYTDRPIYRPGHTVHLKGILRWRQRDALVPFDRPKVELSIVDPDDKVLARQELTVDSFGAVKSSFAVPADAPLGHFAIRLTTGEESASGSFEVQEYRKPEFEVLVLPAERYVLQGRKVTATVRARYYFGQPVARGALTCALYKSSYYSPLRWTDEAEGEPADSYYAGEQIGEHTARLNDQGEATIEIELPEDDNGRDYTLRIDGRVRDGSGREVSGRGSVVGTWGDFLLAASLDRYIYRAGDTAEVRVRAVDYQGKPRANVAVDVAFERITWPEGGGERETTRISSASVQTDAEGRASWKAAIPAGHGSFRFRVSTRTQGRTIEDEASLWVAGASASGESESDTYLELIADKASYAPGETARLLIRGAELDATVLVTKETQAVAWHRVVPLARGAALEVPIADADVGDTWVNVAFMANDRLYRAEKRLRVPPTTHGVQVQIVAAQPVARPRDPGVFTIRTTDAGGAPVRAQVSLAVVDEALFAVKPDDTPDPLRFFYRREYSRVATQFSRDYSFVGYSGTRQLQLARRRRPFSLADFKADREPRPTVRKEFPDAIYWAADLVTDASGTASVKVAYPDALTTWRLTARAVTADTRAGSAIQRTTTTKDLILRLVTPRFLTEGDTVRVPTIVHNYLAEPKTIQVSVSASGLAPAGPLAPVEATVEPRGEARAEWPFEASTVGRSTITATATTPGDGDALELPVPVLPYGTAMEAGEAGSITTPSEQTIDLTIPEQSNPAARTIEVALAPSLAGSLFGALDFLTAYPYGCTEQTVSSFFPNLAVVRTLDELKIAPTERVRLVNRMTADGIKRLVDLQHDDGGFGWWKTDENHPFMTAYALWALAEAAQAGQPPDGSRLANAATATAGLYSKYPRAVPTLKLWMLYALARASSGGVAVNIENGPVDLRRSIEEMWAARGNLTPYGQALLVLTLDTVKDARAAEAAKALAGSAVTKGTLSFWTSENDPLLDDWMDTGVEATAFAVRALAPHLPNDPLLERAVRWLMANRSNGIYWTSTKQTAFALLGILDYLRARRETPTNVAVDVEVNGQLVGQQAFTSADWTRPNPIVVRAPGKAGANRVVLRTRVPGAIYWTATARYYDNRESLEQSGSRTLAVSRKYFLLSPVQKEGRIVYREAPFGGTVQPGDLLLVRITAAGSKDWRYLMLDDPLPAGMEAVQDADAYELERPPRWWYGSKREYRDARVVQFQSDFSAGRYEYVYLLKATTPGRFRAMPARLAPMYSPGVAATSAPQLVDVGSPASGTRTRLARPDQPSRETDARAIAGGER
jgi:uncharacterized protein YfaS (alpha-2-macroglobulin family)